MFVIICLREKDGKTIPIPIMDSDEGGDSKETMAQWMRSTMAERFCDRHILCKSSLNIIVDLKTGHGNIYSPNY